MPSIVGPRLALARQYPKEFAFGANEVSDLEDAPAIVEKYLKLGACIIGEQKFGVACDSAEMQKLYQLAGAYRVPILLHWQVASYNYGFKGCHMIGTQSAQSPSTCSGP